jgi:hypothetical protein
MNIRKSSKITFIAVIVFIAICALSITNLFAQTQNSTAELKIITTQEIKLQSDYSKTAKSEINNSSDAFKTAVESKKYLFTIFYKDAIDDNYKQLEANVLKFIKSTTAEIIIYSANISDTKESEAVKKYGFDETAPFPIAMVFAPNGAVMGGINLDTPESDYSKTIVSPLAMDIMKTVQDGKIALVSLQNKDTKFNEESKKAAKESASDPELGSRMNIIEADPAKSENLEFLKQCRLEDKISEAVLVVIVPPSSIAGVFKGSITKDSILSAITSVASGSGE